MPATNEYNKEYDSMAFCTETDSASVTVTPETLAEAIDKLKKQRPTPFLVSITTSNKLRKKLKESFAEVNNTPIATHYYTGVPLLKDNKVRYGVAKLTYSDGSVEEIECLKSRRSMFAPIITATGGLYAPLN